MTCFVSFGKRVGGFFAAQARWREVYHCPVAYSTKLPFTKFLVLLQLCVCFIQAVSPYQTVNMANTLCRRPLLTVNVFYSRVPQNCPRTYKLPTFDPDGDNVRCRYGSIRSVECSSCTSPSGFDLDQVRQQIQKQGMRKLIIDELIDV